LLFVAASGLARETLIVVRAYGLYDVVGFLDDDPALAGTTIDGVPVLGPIDGMAAYRSAQLLVCAGRGASRERIVGRLDELGVPPTRYATVVHPSVEVPDGCAVGVGSIVLSGVVLTTAVTLGEHVVVMPNVTLTHDCVLHEYVTVCAGVALGGHVVVRRGAYLGMNSAVRERAIVGAGATLGMGAVLLQDLPAGETWAGVPARPILLPQYEGRKTGEQESTIR
jgi:sugar O-acyltransferase (sialic acid O-acetyltransferase NeuD family)